MNDPEYYRPDYVRKQALAAELQGFAQTAKVGASSISGEALSAAEKKLGQPAQGIVWQCAMQAQTPSGQFAQVNGQAVTAYAVNAGDMSKCLNGNIQVLSAQQSPEKDAKAYRRFAAGMIGVFTLLFMAGVARHGRTSVPPQRNAGAPQV